MLGFGNFPGVAADPEDIHEPVSRYSVRLSGLEMGVQPCLAILSLALLCGVHLTEGME